ncbi:MFS transporter [Rhodococcus sp. OK302]|uniref:MFS transporter n=1 Tax=Rhodococcus sp. OK302 TaxID=1882769 RepID=UPI0011403C76|nr:MFS transporter [Rhodococcus sp. OK302]
MNPLNSTPTMQQCAKPAAKRPLGLPPRVAIYVIGALLILSADSETLSILPLLRELSVEYGLDAAQIAWVVALPGLTAAGFVPVMSRLGDMFGVRRMLMVSLTIAGVGNLICTLADGPTGMMAGRALIGGGVACIPLFYAYLRLQSDTEGEVNSAAGFMTAMIGGGLVVSFILGGAIMELGGSVRTVLWIITGLSVVVLILLWVALPENHTRVKHPSTTSEPFCSSQRSRDLFSGSAKETTGVGFRLVLSPLSAEG